MRYTIVICYRVIVVIDAMASHYTRLDCVQCCFKAIYSALFNRISFYVYPVYLDFCSMMNRITESSIAIAHFLWFCFRRYVVRSIRQHQTITYMTVPVSRCLSLRLKTIEKKTLVLDLDETLIHSHSFDAPNRAVKPGTLSDFVLKIIANHQEFIFFVYKRPHVDLFLDTVSEWFNLVVYTSSVEAVGAAIADRLDRNRRILPQRYYRQHCKYESNSYKKDLSSINRDLSRIFILDNSPISYSEYRDNALPIKSWYCDPYDVALLDLLPFLDALQFVRDVRHILSRNLHLPRL